MERQTRLSDKDKARELLYRGYNYVARDIGNTLGAYRYAPKRNFTYWQEAVKDDCILIYPQYFQFVTPYDDKPTSLLAIIEREDKLLIDEIQKAAQEWTQAGEDLRILNEVEFCEACPYNGDPNGCNRKEGVCRAHSSYFELLGRFNQLLHSKEVKNAIKLRELLKHMEDL